jgi:hypothetical protein
MADTDKHTSLPTTVFITIVARDKHTSLPTAVLITTVKCFCALALELYCKKIFELNA